MIVLLGINHRSAPVSIRERMAFPETRMHKALTALRQEEGLAEGLILSTCNRVEVLIRTDADVGSGKRAIEKFLVRECGVSQEELERYSYSFHGRRAVQHLFVVASGLDSMILGEPQIHGQVKQAYKLAQEHGATGPVLDRLMQRCLATAKRVRTETGVSRNSVSVAYAAVKLARNIFGDLSRCRALLFGSGEMAELVAKHLSKSGVERITVSSRTYDRAVHTASRFGGQAVHWDDGHQLLSETDIVVSCTASPRTILSKLDVANARRIGRRGPLFIIDIAVPRDIDPEVNTLRGVYVYDIDALQGVVEVNQEERRRAAEDAERIIGVEVDLFDHWRREQDVAPVIVALRERVLGMGQTEIERFRGRLGPMDAHQEEAVGELVRALLQKILHGPIRQLRQSVDRGDTETSVELLQQFFGFTRDAAKSQQSTNESGPLGPRKVLRGGKRDS